MQVEECSQAILKEFLPILDTKRAGVCIDIGVGTFAFFCELFSRLGFQTIAVEPLPVESLQRLCSRQKIRLIESCISNHDGVCSMYIGIYQGERNLNLSSISPDWWGGSEERIEVNSLTLSSLLADLDLSKITCIKIDVEGSEPVIIKQFIQIPKHLLPTIVIFEYGGGGSKQSGHGGWIENYLNGTIDCLKILKGLGYELVIKLDSSPESIDEYFNLANTELTPETLFEPHNIYGNFIAFRGSPIEIELLKTVCQSYHDSTLGLPAQLPAMGLWNSFIRKIRNRLVYR